MELWKSLFCYHSFQIHSTSVSNVVSMELPEPIDYEKFVKENITMLEKKDMLMFPDDDVTTTTLARKFRTVELPVPGPAK